MAVTLWGSQWQGKSIRCRCDNPAVVAIVSAGSSKDDRAMHLMQSLFFFLVKHNLTLWGSTSLVQAKGQLMACPIIITSPFYPRCHQPGGPLPSSSGSAPSVSGEATRLDIASGQNCFLAFCRQANYKAVLPSETVLCHFVSHLAEQKLKGLPGSH